MDQGQNDGQAVDSLLDAVVEILGIHSACYVAWDGHRAVARNLRPPTSADDFSKFVFAFDHGVIAEDDLSHPWSRWWQRLAGDQVGCQRIDRAEDQAETPAQCLAWHQGDQILGTLCCPVMADGRAIGFLGLRTRDPLGFCDDDRMVAKSLAHGLGLAIKMDQLFDESASSLARVQSLADANALLTRAQWRLSDQPTLDHYLDNMLLEIGETLEAKTVSLFRLDVDEDVLAMTHSILDQQVIDIALDPRFALWRDPIPKDVTDGFSKILRSGGHIFDVDLNDTSMWPQSVAWHENLGNRSAICVPLLGKSDPLGFIGIAFAGERSVAEEKLELARTLSHQASIAMELTRLSDEAKRVVIAEERELATKLKFEESVRVNETLRQSIQGLSQLEDVEDFPDVVLEQISQTVNAASVVAFLFDDDDQTMKMCHAVQFGKIVDIPTDWRYEIWRPSIPMATEQLAELRVLVETNEGVVSDPTSDPLYLSESHRWHRDLGHRGSFLLGMKLDDRMIGMLGVAFSDREPALAAEQMELSRTLTQQATLAVALSRASRDAKQATINRERERAALEKAAGLASANASLRKTVDRLVVDPKLNSFLELIVQEASVHVRAHMAHLFLVDPETLKAKCAVAIEDGKVVDMQNDPTQQIWNQSFDTKSSTAWQQISRGTSRVERLDVSDPEQQRWSWPGTLQWHADRGHTKLLCIPIRGPGIDSESDASAVGFLGFAFTEGYQFDDSEVELAEALGQQATLALHLTGLAEKAQKAAITEERNRMAREIHDTVAQGLTGVLLQLEGIQATQGTLPERIEEFTVRAKEMARGALIESRRSVLALRPHQQDVSFVEELKRVPECIGRNDVDWHVLASDEGRELPALVRHELLRIAQESTTNAMRHGAAKRIEIRFEGDAENWMLEISDNGCGFDPQQVGHSKGFGLLGMRERVLAIDGQIEIYSRPQEGTRVTVTVKRA